MGSLGCPTTNLNGVPSMQKCIQRGRKHPQGGASTTCLGDRGIWEGCFWIQRKDAPGSKGGILLATHHLPPHCWPADDIQSLLGFVLQQLGEFWSHWTPAEIPICFYQFEHKNIPFRRWQGGKEDFFTWYLCLH